MRFYLKKRFKKVINKTYDYCLTNQKNVNICIIYFYLILKLPMMWLLECYLHIHVFPVKTGR